MGNTGLGETPRSISEWQKLFRPVEEALGLKVRSFDPTVTFHLPGSTEEYVQVPVWFLTRLNAALRAPTKYFLFTQTHDWEGSFGEIEEFCTQEEAAAAAVEFEKQQSEYSTQQGWNWMIVGGDNLLEGRAP